MNDAANCWRRQNSSDRRESALRWPGHRDGPSEPNGGCAVPSVKPCSCARDWRNDGAPAQPVTHDVRGRVVPSPLRAPAVQGAPPPDQEAGRFAAAIRSL
jgi:hypothetical protein